MRLQRTKGAAEDAARTSALLVDLVKDPKERAERRRESALLMAERGAVREAAALLEQSLVEDPQDEAALTALCELADRLPEGFGLSEKLARVLDRAAAARRSSGGAQPPRAPVAAPRRAA